MATPKPHKAKSPWSQDQIAWSAAASGLNPEDWTFFQVAKRRVNSQYQTGLAQNEWQRGTLKNQQGIRLGDLARRLEGTREGMSGQFAAQGLLDSGIKNRRLAQFEADRQRAKGMINAQYGDQIFGLDLADKQLETLRAGSLNDIEAQFAARRAAAAAVRAA